MFKEEKWTGAVALFLITFSQIVRNCEGHSYQTENITGNSGHTLKWFTESASSAAVQFVRTVQPRSTCCRLLLVLKFKVCKFFSFLDYLLCRGCGADIADFSYIQNRFSPEALIYGNQSLFGKQSVAVQLLENPLGIRFRVLVVNKANCIGVDEVRFNIALRYY